jgi:hypothetical protein
MFKLTHIMAIAALVMPTALCAEETPPKTDKPKSEEGNRSGDQGRGGGREEFFKRMQEENPELKGVDMNSPEGQEKMREVMAKRMEKEAPRIRERIAESKTASLVELNKKLGMAAEEFAAIQPLIERVENLQSQRGMVDVGGRSGSPFGRGDRGPSSFFNPQLLLGDTELEPTVKEIQEAAKILKTLNADKQANETEIVSALTRLRKARESFSTLLKNAQNELRTVLTPQQESMMVERGTLE